MNEPHAIEYRGEGRFGIGVSSAALPDSPFNPKLYPTEADVDRAFHPLPKSDDWKAVTLARIAGIRIILGCCDCQRRAMVWPRAYAEKHGIAMDLPLRPWNDAFAARRATQG